MNTAYRVWDGEQMHYWDDEGLSLTIKNNGDWTLKRLYTDVLVPVVDSTNRNAALMWGTGLKDKNEKMIYEKDVIKFKSVYCENKIIKAVVKFRDSLGSFVFNRGDDQDFWRMDVSLSEIEVIGDIYQNPELLEGAE
ncbi:MULTISPECIES: YopX family protein [Bacillus]|uniref:YopX family protein n=2 Tax=Bacillaceae TaxID=186817 RepID=UPI0007790A07|nr:MULTISPECIES: YopX family protein [Bacillus amyloliquefaciens group]ASZ03924.1 hypothetical protein CJP14_08635 [Bacillus velezensis]KYC94858.1 hypothetical protein B425_1767 [Bacillus amyloliquefaciens]MBW8280003.1 YopX family protein [Bacillus amyloliquefaciens]MCB5334832.1 SPbeta prophage-derived uncharacterized protein YopX [Bacillus amyloliquefaciens]MEC1250350.1 YopX family protein [Bacillus amyloliquefaciens]